MPHIPSVPIETRYTLRFATGRTLRFARIEDVYGALPTPCTLGDSENGVRPVLPHYSTGNTAPFAWITRVA